MQILRQHLGFLKIPFYLKNKQASLHQEYKTLTREKSDWKAFIPYGKYTFPTEYFGGNKNLPIILTSHSSQVINKHTSAVKTGSHEAK